MGVNAHTGDVRHLFAQLVGGSVLGVPLVHGQQQIGDGGGDGLGGAEHQALEGSGVLVEEIAVADGHHLGAMAHPHHRQTHKKRGQGGVAADELVPVFPDEAAQLPGGGDIFGRGHALLQGDGVQLAGMGQLHHCPAAGHIHFPALFRQGL